MFNDDFDDYFDDPLDVGFDRYVVDTLFKKGDIDKISSILSNRELRPNQKDEMGYSILMEALNKAPISVVELLVENGADVHYTVNVNGELVDCFSHCLMVSKKDTNSKIAFLANNGIKLTIDRLKHLNSKNEIFAKLDIDKIFTENKDVIIENQLRNLIPQTVKDIFFQ